MDGDSKQGDIPQQKILFCFDASHRKVDFSHSKAAFDLLCPFVSLLLLPGELTVDELNW